MQKFIPLYDQVLVRSIDSSTTKFGIVIPGNLDDNKSEVVAVGEGHIMQDGSIRPLTVQVGQTVLTAGSGMAVELDGQKFQLFRESAILGILTEVAEDDVVA